MKDGDYSENSGDKRTKGGHCNEVGFTEVAMITGLYDWEDISNKLSTLRLERKRVEERANAEIQRLEDTIHIANKQLNGFIFKLTEIHGEYNPHSTIEVNLLDVAEQIELPWRFEANYFL
ncbi:hypothetical protein ABIE62_000437 [Porphyrobacter sp. MBR-155]|jgi:hypothetical protein|uniref:hypothetical protein n=1 Tax=Porphyrobacter sp. MBR-155 TaxID=3156464 RepID=UPI00339AC8FC